jgi:hypothetical protein
MPDHEMVNVNMESRNPILDLQLEPVLETSVGKEGKRSSNGGKWFIVMEEVWFPCFGSSSNLQVHGSEAEARSAFGSLKGPRILVDADGVEVTAAAGAPWKSYALRMIRQKLSRNYYALPCHHAGLRKEEEISDMAEFDFSDNEFFNPDDFTRSGLAVELPSKTSPSDMVSTVGDLGSSRTTHSDFTIATQESGRSSEVPPMPQADGEPMKLLSPGHRPGKSTGLADENSTVSNDSLDICQSTTSSVYRLLDIDSRSGSYDEE